MKVGWKCERSFYLPALFESLSGNIRNECGYTCIYGWLPVREWNDRMDYTHSFFGTEYKHGIARRSIIGCFCKDFAEIWYMCYDEYNDTSIPR